jgi:hypothetical protein
MSSIEEEDDNSAAKEGLGLTLDVVAEHNPTAQMAAQAGQVILSVREQVHEGHSYYVAILATTAGVALAALAAPQIAGLAGLTRAAMLAAEAAGYGEATTTFIAVNGAFVEAGMLGTLAKEGTEAMTKTMAWADPIFQDTNIQQTLAVVGEKTTELGREIGPALGNLGDGVWMSVNKIGELETEAAASLQRAIENASLEGKVVLGDNTWVSVKDFAPEKLQSPEAENPPVAPKEFNEGIADVTGQSQKDVNHPDVTPDVPTTELEHPTTVNPEFGTPNPNGGLDEPPAAIELGSTQQDGPPPIPPTAVEQQNDAKPDLVDLLAVNPPAALQDEGQKETPVIAQPPTTQEEPPEQNREGISTGTAVREETTPSEPPAVNPPAVLQDEAQKEALVVAQPVVEQEREQQVPVNEHREENAPPPVITHQREEIPTREIVQREERVEVVEERQPYVPETQPPAPATPVEVQRVEVIQEPPPIPEAPAEQSWFERGIEKLGTLMRGNEPPAPEVMPPEKSWFETQLDKLENLLMGRGNQDQEQHQSPPPANEQHYGYHGRDDYHHEHERGQPWTERVGTQENSPHVDSDGGRHTTWADQNPPHQDHTHHHDDPGHGHTNDSGHGIS